VEEYGTPADNPEFWSAISANSFLEDLSEPIQLHHRTADASVPLEFSESLFTQLQQAGKETELYTYPDDNHNLSNSFSQAMTRTILFFDKHLKDAN
jgi:dipeptidyl aminopeptidase/acylaminoacyl peptidase